MKKLTGMLSVVSMLIAVLGTANAALVGFTNNGGLSGRIIQAPGQVLNGSRGNNNRQLAFDEQQNFTLLNALAVDNNSNIANGGMIDAGTTVNSHMIFLNKRGNPNGPLVANNTWEFDGTILGVMSDRPGALEALSSGILGATGTTYPGGFGSRGMEGNVTNGTGDFYTLPGLNTLQVRMRVTQPGDWIRVITASAVPIPSAMLLFGTGLIGLIAFRGFQKK